MMRVYAALCSLDIEIEKLHDEFKMMRYESQQRMRKFYNESEPTFHHDEIARDSEPRSS